jgi:hypothetical protein
MFSAQNSEAQPRALPADRGPDIFDATDLDPRPLAVVGYCDVWTLIFQ